jgi:ubiquitin-protein ligase
MAGEVSRRQIRLEKERVRLASVNEDSDYVRVVPVDVLPDQPPEKYKASFSCRGITGIDSSRNPVYGTHHEVTIYCHDDFPSDVPWLRWETPIWHPNVEHKEPKNVCVNKHEWLGGMTLVDLCQQLFEMVQYKNYHAEHKWPYPLDAEAAVWVREYAEPRGLVDKKRGIYVDNRPFYRPTAAEPASQIHIPPQPAGGGLVPRIKIQSPKQASARAESRVVLHAGGQPLYCQTCAAELASDSKFCDKCGTRVERERRVRFGS